MILKAATTLRALLGLMGLGALGIAVDYLSRGTWGFGALSIAVSAVSLGSFLLVGRLEHFLRGEHTRLAILEQKLTAQSEAIDGLADGLDIAVFLTDTEGTIQFANERACEMFRFANPEGQSILAVTLTHTLVKLVRQAAERRETQTAELRILSGEEITVLARAWPELPGATRVFLTLLDITQLRHLERVRKDFVANVSHELRTPLTTIRAMSEVLVDVDPDETARRSRYLNQIISEVDRLTLIVGDLLTLSEAEGRELQTEPFDLTEVLEGIIFQLRQKAERKHLDLEFSGPEVLDVTANRGQLAQVAVNLIDNAINYTTEGTIRVSLKQEGELAVLSVTDTGIGIPSEDLPRVFERFYRVDKSRSRESGGTGLGLSIVKHVVESHGGRVSVQSSLNRGTTFRVEIPNRPPELRAPTRLSVR